MATSSPHLVFGQADAGVWRVGGRGRGARGEGRGEGKVTRTSPIRVIRDGIVIFTGRLGSLKRFKDDAKEVTLNMECGLNIESYNDIRIGDIIESFDQVEVKKK